MPKLNSRLILSIVIILIVTLIPIDGKSGGQYLDKVGHFLIFAFYGFQLASIRPHTRMIIVGLTFGIVLAYLTEFLQQFIPGRNYETLDIIADISGLIFGYLTFHLLSMINRR